MRPPRRAHGESEGRGNGPNPLPAVISSASEARPRPRRSTWDNSHNNRPPRAASRPGGGALGGADIQQYLTFQLTGEMYAVGILNVKEIIEYGSLTEIPMMPAFIRGVINLRGAWCR
jgi:hypothetical protein